MMSEAAHPDHPLRAAVIKALRTVHDPEIPVNIHDLGLIYGMEFRDDGAVTITMTLTAPNCPMAEMIVQQVRQNVAAVEGVGEVNVNLVWEPKWSADMMSEAAKLELEYTGHTAPAHLRKSKLSQLTVGKSARPKNR